MFPIPETADQRIFQALYAAQQVAQRLSSLVTSLSPKYAHVRFYTRARVKTFDSIKAKINRKRNFERKPFYNLTSLTDIVGLRIVALYDEDLPEAMQFVLDLLRAGQTFVQPLIYGESIWTSFKEAKFFVRPGSTAVRPDIYRLCRDRCIDLMTKELVLPQLVGQLAQRMQIIPEGQKNDYTYPSAHFVVNARYYSENIAYPVYVEIQLRTALEDVWAEVSHELLYKSKEFYVWAPEIDEAYADLKTISTRVKALMEGAAQEMIHFKRHYLGNYLTKIEEFRNPRAAFYSSLGVTLLQAMGQRFLINIGAIFYEYEQALGRLTQSYSAHALQDCFTKFLLVQEHLRKQRTNKRDKAGSHALAQQQKLSQFEMLRLQTLFLTDFRHKKKAHRFEAIPAVRPNEEDIGFKSEALKIYAELCKIRNDLDLQLKPISAILFWKYYVLRKIDPNSAYMYLRMAYDELSFDTSLPDWSIYHVLIPRSLAIEIQSDISSLTADFSTVAKVAGPEIRGQIRGRVILATRYAIQASELTFSHDRRGDIIFGFEDDHFVKDGDIILSVLLDYFRFVGTAGVRDTIFDEIEITGEFLQNLPIRGRAASAAAGKDYPVDKGRDIDRKLKELLHFYNQNQGLLK
jgi:ppGpp synthetase/RelA/SpoT-type nucleotidyltranferase